MKRLLFLLTLLGFVRASAQDTLSQDFKNLMALSDHYKAISSLQMEIAYKAYADTLERTLLDSSLEKFLSYKGRTHTDHLRTVSIVSDSLMFFIDHDRKMAVLEKKPPMANQAISRRLATFLKQGKGYTCYKAGKDTRYRIQSDGLTYDWIDIYVDLHEKKLRKVVYRFSDKNKAAKGAKLLVIDFQKQIIGKPVSGHLFGLQDYFSAISAKGTVLLPSYQSYKFYNYLY